MKKELIKLSICHAQPLVVFFTGLCVVVLCIMVFSILNVYKQNQHQLIYYEDTQVKIILPIHSRGNNYDDSIYGKSTNYYHKKGVWSNIFYNVKENQRYKSVARINATHINGIPMENINVNYTRNIYFTMKTTHKYYEQRLFPLMSTWLQLVDKNKLSIISDSPASDDDIMIRKAGFNIINTDCKIEHARVGLCCKMGTEFSSYYNAVDEHKNELDDYQWYCHFDDDMYVNIHQLSRLLQQYDPYEPHYIGKWPESRKTPNIILKRKVVRYIAHLNYTLKYTWFKYANGPAFCISYTLMMEAKKYFNGVDPLTQISSVPHLPQDMTIGFVINSLLGYNLTEVSGMKSQLSNMPKSSLKQLTNYITIGSSIKRNNDFNKLATLLKTPLPPDPSMFLLYHCLLYPTVSWCWSVRELLNEINEF